jgi:hypothetical protein
MATTSTDLPFRKARFCVCLAAVLGTAPMHSLAFAGVVQNCGDGGPGSGSLRDVITTAAPGDTVDLSQLPAKCGMQDSVITLSNGQISIPQDNLKLQGPSAGSVAIVPAAGSNFRIFDHTGTGLLVLNDLRVANGHVQAGASSALGGCIYSKGTLFATRTIVENCTADGGAAFGGGIYAYGSAVLLKSTVSGNKAIGTSFRGSGGGVYARTGLHISDSTLSDNEASTFGGAVYSNDSYQTAYAAIYNSTISGNRAGQCAGATLYSPAGTVIANTTVSGNEASLGNGGLCLRGNVGIANTTVAFNAGTNQSSGLIMWAGSLTLESVLVANNSAAVDVQVYGNANVSGAGNLITSSNGVPMSTIVSTADPKLLPLARNGGLTSTHALTRDSPALRAGNNIAGLWVDQRGRGYPRWSGANFEVDIGAVQFDSIFYGDVDP